MRRARVIVLDRRTAATLRSWARAVRADQVRAFRARIVLLAALGLTNKEIARQLRSTEHTVGRWRTRFARSGPDGLAPRPPWRPRRIAEETVQRALALTEAGSGPLGGPWTAQGLALALGIGVTSVRRIWTRHGVSPERGHGATGDPRRLGRLVSRILAGERLEDAARGLGVPPDQTRAWRRVLAASVKAAPRARRARRRTTGNA